MSIETDIFTTSVAEWGWEFLLWNNFTDIYITKWDENCCLLSKEKSFVWLFYKYLTSFLISDFYNLFLKAPQLSWSPGSCKGSQGGDLGRDARASGLLLSHHLTLWQNQPRYSLLDRLRVSNTGKCWEPGPSNWCLEPVLPGLTGFQWAAWSAKETETHNPLKIQLQSWFVAGELVLQLPATENKAVFHWNFINICMFLQCVSEWKKWRFSLKK